MVAQDEVVNATDPPPIVTPSRHSILRSSAIRGPGAMLLSAVLFGAMGPAVRIAAQGGVPPAESTFVRFATGLAICLLLARAGAIDLQVRRPALHFVRGLCGSVSALLFFVAVSQIALAKATLLCFTHVIFSAFFGVLVLRERLGPGAALALGTAMVGVALVTGARLSGIGPGEASALLSGLLGGAAITSIRELRRTETAYSVFATFCIFGVLTSVLMASEPWVLPRGDALLALVAVAVLATAGQLLMTAAYRYCSVALGGLLSLLTVVLAAPLGLLFFDEGLTVKTLAGSVLVLGAAAYLTVAQANGS
jgi:drug/metabolite transporter (DMT)-like permease